MPQNQIRGITANLASTEPARGLPKNASVHGSTRARAAKPNGKQIKAVRQTVYMHCDIVRWCTGCNCFRSHGYGLQLRLGNPDLAVRRDRLNRSDTQVRVHCRSSIQTPGNATRHMETMRDARMPNSRIVQRIRRTTAKPSRAALDGAACRSRPQQRSHL